MVVHGDDFTSLGTDPELNWLETMLAKHFEIKIRGRLGEGCPGDNELRILNRVVRITPEGLTYEADPRHVDILKHSINLEDGNSVASPGIKESEPDYGMIKTDEIPQVTNLSEPQADNIARHSNANDETDKKDNSSFKVFAFSHDMGENFLQDYRSDSPQRPLANLSETLVTCQAPSAARDSVDNGFRGMPTLSSCLTKHYHKDSEIAQRKLNSKICSVNRSLRFFT